MQKGVGGVAQIEHWYEALSSNSILKKNPEESIERKRWKIQGGRLVA
jgi:hypothetical protein